MTIALRFPPTLASLLEDETYSIYLSRKPKMPGTNPTPAWLIMAQTVDLKWKRALCMDYSQALERAHRLISLSSFRDVSIISRRRIFKEPSWSGVLSDDPMTRWCGRCRRPTLFKEYGYSHPALKDAPVMVEFQQRCFYCGAREGLACAKNRFAPPV